MTAIRSIRKFFTELSYMESIAEVNTKDLQKTLHQLEVANIRLEKAITFQKAILNNAGAIIVCINEDGIIQTFNREAEIELGYKAKELIGRNNPLIFHDRTEVLLRAKEISKELQYDIPVGMEVFLAKARLGLHNEHEWTYICRNGSKFPGLLNVTAMRDDQNEIIGFLGIAINISERKKVEQELHKSLEKEKELSELKSRFVSMASHEFRTPLSTVLSSAYLIEQYITTEDQPKREKHLQRIITSVNMLTDILNDFLSVGKIEEGKIHVRPSHFNLKELVTTLSDEMRYSLKKGQIIRTHHSGTTDAFLDTSLFKHIILNLVSNASKFSSEEGLIEINTNCSKHQVTLSVKDYGIGISREDQKHLMERFFRGANAGNIQGTGLGLHIVSKYAELMNGTVHCKSELDKGTTFKIIFKIKTV